MNFKSTSSIRTLMDYTALKKGKFMESHKVRFNSIDEYISNFPEEIRKLMTELRGTIKASAPEAIEKISYQIPTFYLKGNLVHFAGFKNHIVLSDLNWD